MANTAKLSVIVDEQGKVLAAQLTPQSTSPERGEGPFARLAPLQNQRELTIELPAEVLKLTGEEIQKLFSSLRVGQDGKVKLPDIKVIPKSKT